MTIWPDVPTPLIAASAQPGLRTDCQRQGPCPMRLRATANAAPAPEPAPARAGTRSSRTAAAANAGSVQTSHSSPDDHTNGRKNIFTWIDGDDPCAAFSPSACRRDRFACSGSVRFVVGVSVGHSPTAGTAACSSPATTAWLVADTHRCNNVPSVASAENSSRIPSVNTAGSVAAVLSRSSFVGFVDFFEKLNDLDWGSWERSLPEGSSLGAGMPLLSEAPFNISLRRRPFSAYAGRYSIKPPLLF